MEKWERNPTSKKVAISPGRRGMKQQGNGSKRTFFRPEDSIALRVKCLSGENSLPEGVMSDFSGSALSRPGRTRGGKEFLCNWCHNIFTIGGREFWVWARFEACAGENSMKKEKKIYRRSYRIYLFSSRWLNHIQELFFSGSPGGSVV